MKTKMTAAQRAQALRLVRLALFGTSDVKEIQRRHPVPKTLAEAKRTIDEIIKGAKS